MFIAMLLGLVLAAEKNDDVVLPNGSADYRRIVKRVKQYKSGALTMEKLTAAVLALKLPPHQLGDGYLEMTPPPPPPGMKFEPALMPPDWKGTWGEVAMAWLGGWGLTREEYESLHQAAHGKEPGFPNCKR